MILGFHNMADGLRRRAADHLTSEKAWPLLALDGILLIPFLFAAFFYPLVAISLGGVLIVGLGLVALTCARFGHRHRAGRAPDVASPATPS